MTAERAQHETQEPVVQDAEEADEVVGEEVGPDDGIVDRRPSGAPGARRAGPALVARPARGYAPQLLTSTPSALMPAITRDGTSATGSQS